MQSHKGKRISDEKRAAIRQAYKSGQSWAEIQRTLHCSSKTIKKVLGDLPKRGMGKKSTPTSNPLQLVNQALLQTNVPADLVRSFAAQLERAIGGRLHAVHIDFAARVALVESIHAETISLSAP